MSNDQWVKAHYSDPLWGTFGSSIIIQYNCSKSMVDLILGINAGFWALQQLFLQKYYYILLLF